MKIILLRVGLMIKTILSLRRDFQISFLLISQKIVMIEVLIQNIKRGEMLIYQKREQLKVSVVRNMWVNVLLGLIVSTVVEKVVVW